MKLFALCLISIHMLAFTQGALAQASCEVQARAAYRPPPVYSENKDPLVFVGTVSAVRPLETGDGVEIFDIEFNAQQWARGPQQSPVVVRGYRQTKWLVECPPPTQFFPQPGERWIIFGVMEEGKLSPNAHYSTPVLDEKHLKSVLKQLKK